MLTRPINGMISKMVFQRLVIMCGKKKDRTNHSDTWWWNEEVNEAIQQKKVAYKNCLN